MHNIPRQVKFPHNIPRLEKFPHNIPRIVKFPHNIPRLVKFPHNIPRLVKFPHNIPRLEKFPHNIPRMVKFPHNIPRLEKFPHDIPRLVKFPHNIHRKATRNFLRHGVYRQPFTFSFAEKKNILLTLGEGSVNLTAFSHSLSALSCDVLHYGMKTLVKAKMRHLLITWILYIITRVVTKVYFLSKCIDFSLHQIRLIFKFSLFKFLKEKIPYKARKRTFTDFM